MHRIAACQVGVLALLFSSVASGQDVTRLTSLSLDSLLSMRVSAAARYEQGTRDAPAAITIITAVELQQHGARTLEEALQLVRGFYSSYDRNYSYVGTRGFGRPTDYNNRFLVLIDGHPVNEPVYGSMPAGTDLGIDLGIVERIEIARGPGSAVYGSNAMFAVINLVTRRGGDIRGVEIATTIGSSDRRQLSVVAGTQLAGVQVSLGANVAHVGGTDLYFADYDTPATNDGMARDRDRDAWRGVLARVDYKGLSILGRTAIREKGIPTGAWNTTFNGDASTSDSWRALDLTWQRELTPEMNLTFFAGYNHYSYEGHYPYADGTKYDDSDDARWLTTTAQLVWDATARARFTVGAERVSVFRADYWGDVASGAGGDFPYSVLSGFAQAEYGITDRLTAHLGLRLDDHSATGTFLAPRGVLVFRPDELTSLKLVAGKAYRVPNVYELYYRELYDLGAGFDALRSETIRTVELNAERRLSETLLGTVSLFSYNVDDLIDLAFEDNIVRYENRANAKARGVEVQIEHRLARDLGLRASYSFQDAFDGDSGEPLTNSPKHLVKLAASIGLPLASTFSGQMQYASSRTTANGLPTDGFVVFNGIFHTPQLLHGLTASLEARNLFNTTYSTPAGTEHLQSSIVQDGRRLSVGLRYRFK